jgi:hypothetical protein
MDSGPAPCASRNDGERENKTTAEGAPKLAAWVERCDTHQLQ